jgi:hypothetical protein
MSFLSGGGGHAHSGRFASFLEEPLSQRPKKIGLLGKSCMFVVRSAEGICHAYPGVIQTQRSHRPVGCSGTRESRELSDWVP